MISTLALNKAVFVFKRTLSANILANYVFSTKLARAKKNCFLIYVYNTFMYNIYAIVILILFDIPLFSVNSLHQFQAAAAPRFPEVTNVLSKQQPHNI